MRRLSRRLPDKIAAPNVRMNSGTAKVRNAHDIQAPLGLRYCRTRAPHLAVGARFADCANCIKSRLKVLSQAGC